MITGHLGDGRVFSGNHFYSPDNSKQTTENTHKNTKTQTNKVALGMKNTQKPKPPGPSSSASAHMCHRYVNVLMIVYNCGSQYST